MKVSFLFKCVIPVLSWKVKPQGPEFDLGICYRSSRKSAARFELICGWHAQRKYSRGFGSGVTFVALSVRLLLAYLKLELGMELKSVFAFLNN